ncbi:MAG: LamG-like jellyroll fold domain-containing protein [Cyclobacteriaceae bacterium]
MDTHCYARVPDAPSLDIEDEITVAAWVKPAKRSSQKIIAKGDSKIADGYELSLLSTGKASFRINQQTSETYKINSTTQYPIDGTWIHIAATFKGTNMKIFINGVQNKSLTFAIPASVGPNTLPLVIGAAVDETSNFQGSIDEVSVYNYALQANEIYALASGSEEKNNTAARVRTENIQINNEGVLQYKTHVYPNPADNTLFVELTHAKKSIISITDMNGRLLHRMLATGENNEIAIDLGELNLEKGLYILCIQSSDSIRKTKFLKK